MLKRQYENDIEPLQIFKKRNVPRQDICQIPEPYKVQPKKKTLKKSQESQLKINILAPKNLRHNHTKSQDYPEDFKKIHQKWNQQQLRNLQRTPVYDMMSSLNKQNIESKFDDSEISIEFLDFMPQTLKPKDGIKTVDSKQEENHDRNYWMNMAKKYHNELSSEKIKNQNLEQRLRKISENMKSQRDIQVQQLNNKVKTLTDQLSGKKREIKQKDSFIEQLIGSKKLKTIHSQQEAVPF